jgi:hypothetical protein
VKRLIECDNRGSRGRANGNRIRMYAGPVSWVSNYKHWLCPVKTIGENVSIGTEI